MFYYFKINLNFEKLHFFIMENNQNLVAQTKKWIKDVVVGCNFCPFASREVKKDSIRYITVESAEVEDILLTLENELTHLDDNIETETTLIILQNGFTDFEEYLDLVNIGEEILAELEYEGVYQLASFHPKYIFHGTEVDDASNYTNRSPYPMLHLLREESVTLAVDSHPNPEGIPVENINYTKEKGLAHMQSLLAACFDV